MKIEVEVRGKIKVKGIFFVWLNQNNKLLIK